VCVARMHFLSLRQASMHLQGLHVHVVVGSLGASYMPVLSLHAHAARQRWLQCRLRCNVGYHSHTDDGVLGVASRLLAAMASHAARHATISYNAPLGDAGSCSCCGIRWRGWRHLHGWKICLHYACMNQRHLRMNDNR
jgi:hypothetical protein